MSGYPPSSSYSWDTLQRKKRKLAMQRPSANLLIPYLSSSVSGGEISLARLGISLSMYICLCSASLQTVFFVSPFFFFLPIELRQSSLYICLLLCRLLHFFELYISVFFCFCLQGFPHSKTVNSTAFSTARERKGGETEVPLLCYLFGAVRSSPSLAEAEAILPFFLSFFLLRLVLLLLLVQTTIRRAAAKRL